MTDENIASFFGVLGILTAGGIVRLTTIGELWVLPLSVVTIGLWVWLGGKGV